MWCSPCQVCVWLLPFSGPRIHPHTLDQSMCFPLIFSFYRKYNYICNKVTSCFSPSLITVLLVAAKLHQTSKHNNRWHKMAAPPNCCYLERLLLFGLSVCVCVCALSWLSHSLRDTDVGTKSLHYPGCFVVAVYRYCINVCSPEIYIETRPVQSALSCSGGLNNTHYSDTRTHTYTHICLSL